MEDHDNKNFVLELDNQQFEVNKKKLINTSQYFATFFSENSSSVYKIESDIPVISFKDFIKCINCDKRNVIIDAIENMNVDRLLNLLNLSVLYKVKDEFKLTETIIDILQKNNFTLQEALNAWLMAKKLNLKMLRDLSFSVCLDRFTEMPFLTCELSKENFLELIKNTNLRIPKTIDAKVYLSTVAEEWMRINKDTIPLDNLEKIGPKVYQSIIFYNRQNYYDNKEFNLHCWDGDKFFELATFKLPEKLINNQILIEEMKIIARGHNLYFIGGEFGIDSRKFNTKVWRYSLITKNWHFETTMPCGRKKMIAAFVQNKLLLAGGYGSNDQQLQSLDIYNIHKGTWTKGADMPFIYIEPYCCFNVIDKHLVFFFCFEFEPIYIYNSEINCWCKIEANNYKQKLHLHDLLLTASVIQQFKTASCDVDKTTQNRINLRTIVCDNSKYKQKFYEKYAKYLEYLGINEKYKKKNYFDMYFYFIENLFNDGMYDCYMLFCSKKSVEYKLIYLKKEHLPWHSMLIQNQNTDQSSLEICSTMFSNLMNPADLYAN